MSAADRLTLSEHDYGYYYCTATSSCRAWGRRVLIDGQTATGPAVCALHDTPEGRLASLWPDQRDRLIAGDAPTLIRCSRCGNETTEPLVAAGHRCTVTVEALHDGSRIRAERRHDGQWVASIYDDRGHYATCAEKAADAQGALDVARAELDLWATA